MIKSEFPAVVIHSLADARQALAPGRPVTLLSGEGAALYAGCGWWQALTRTVRHEFPQLAIADLLDCADASGQALAAVRIGLRHLILHPGAPGHARVASVLAECGGVLLSERPPALDLADAGHGYRLHEWVQARSGPDDRRGLLR